MLRRREGTCFSVPERRRNRRALGRDPRGASAASGAIVRAGCLWSALVFPQPLVGKHEAFVFHRKATETGHVTRLTLRLFILRLFILVASVLLGTCAALVDTRPAFACSCAGISTNRALREADAVFRGSVISKETVGRGDTARTDIRFAVDRVYKGTVYQEQVVASRHDAGACGLDPELGSTWVIFAIEGIEGEGDRAVNRLITTLCSGNLPTGTAPGILGIPRPPLSGASDREERSTNADRIISRGLAIVGIGGLCLVAVALIGVGLLWRPGRSV